MENVGIQWKAPVEDDKSDEQNDGDSDEVYFVEAFGKRRHREAPFGGGDSDCGAKVHRQASGDGDIGKHGPKVTRRQLKAPPVGQF